MALIRTNKLPAGLDIQVSAGKAYSMLDGTLTEISFPISGVSNNTHGYIANVKDYTSLSMSASTTCTSYFVGIKADGSVETDPMAVPAASRTIDVTNYDYIIFYDMYTSGYTVTYSLS